MEGLQMTVYTSKISYEILRLFTNIKSKIFLTSNIEVRNFVVHILTTSKVEVRKNFDFPKLFEVKPS